GSATVICGWDAQSINPAIEDALKRGMATRRQNALLTVRGVTGTLPELMQHFDCKLSHVAVRKRVKAGMDLERALTQAPVTGKRGKQYTAFGVTDSLGRLAKRFGCEIDPQSIRGRLRNGMSIE